MREPIVLRVTAVLFTALYAVAMFLPTLPEGAYPDARVLALVTDADERRMLVLGGYALTLAGVVFLVWLAALSSRLVDSGTWVAGLVLVGGIGYGLFVMLAATAFSGVALGVTVGELPQPDDAYLVRVVSNLGFHLLLVPGLLCASVLVAAATVLARRRHTLPMPVLVAGGVIAPLLWAGALWAPQFLVPIWMILVSVWLRAPAAPATAGSGSAGAVLSGV